MVTGATNVQFKVTGIDEFVIPKNQATIMHKVF